MLEEDLSRIALIESTLFSHAWSKEDFLMEIQKNPFSSYWVVEEQGKLVAYLGLWLMGTQAQITTLGVLLEEQHKGYAYALLNHAFDLCKEAQIPMMSLEVRVSNQSAINLYQKCDFKIKALRKDYYSSPNEDAYLMIKEMEEA